MDKDTAIVVSLVIGLVGVVLIALVNTLTVVFASTEGRAAKRRSRYVSADSGRQTNSGRQTIGSPYAAGN